MYSVVFWCPITSFFSFKKLSFKEFTSLSIVPVRDLAFLLSSLSLATKTEPLLLAAERKQSLLLLRRGRAMEEEKREGGEGLKNFGSQSP